ncbi:MAG: hypothetical protein A2050_09445 [Candidatus Rokubacteria bacterium GWA2_73_35]|nr:MAG: hypothetical protein A2050_09445 [Candidatus Rokubacteria bacterium GWA2_73_35]
MPSIVPRMSSTRRELSSICFIVWATSCTCSAAFAATSLAVAASEFARAQLEAFCLPVAASSSMPEAISSSDAACSCVRWERLALPSAMSLAMATMESALARTWPTIWTRSPFIRASERHRRPVSDSAASEKSATVTRAVRSPLAMRSTVARIRDMPIWFQAQAPASP